MASPLNKHLTNFLQISDNFASVENWIKDGGEVQKIDVAMGLIRHFSVHPDGQRIAFSSMGANPEQSQVWVMENFLPAESKSKGQI